MGEYKSNSETTGSFEPTLVEKRGGKLRTIAVLATFAVLGAGIIASHVYAANKAETPDTRPICSYTVESGTTLSEYADRLDTSVDSLMKTNKMGKDPSIMASGELLGPCTEGEDGKPVASVASNS